MSAGWTSDVGIAPSILTADLGRLAEEIAAAENGGADVMHIDVMDGQFVPQISFGPLIVEAVRKATSLPIEVHMMVVDPLKQLEPLADAGAGRLIFHLEATEQPEREIARTRELDCEVGMAISPQTPASALEPWLPQLDEVTVMLVHPGRGGQELIVEQLDKVRELRAALDAWHRAELQRSTPVTGVWIEVDGGVKAHNAAQCVEAGADLLVAGSAVYNPRQTPQQAIAELRSAIGRPERVRSERGD